MASTQKMCFMKKIMITAAIVGLTAFTTLAQPLTNKTFHGQLQSEETGLLSKLKSRSKNVDALSRTPLFQSPFYGSREQTATTFRSRATSDVDYGFNSSTYQGLNVPLQSIGDQNGNVYATGVSADADNPKGHFITIKTDASGAIAWTYRKPVSDYVVEYGTAITFDAANNPVAVGMHWNGNNMDVHTQKLDAATGQVLWQADFAGTSNGLDIPTALIVDSDGNTIVTGITYTGTDIRFLVLKYNPQGTLLWSFTDDNAVADSWNEPSAVAVDASGNIAVTGSGSTADYYQKYYTLKLSSAGTKLWGRDLEHQVPSDPEDPSSPLTQANALARAVAFDAQGNCYVTGSLDTGSATMGTLKYDTSGNQQWLSIYKSGTDNTTAHQIAIRENTIYISGRHMGDWIEDGLVLISYNADGAQNWVRETTNLGDTRVPHMVLDSSDRPIISGHGYADNMDTVLSAVRYETDGTLSTATNLLIPANPSESFGGFTGFTPDSQGNLTFSLSYAYTELGNVFRIFKIPFENGNPTIIWNTNYAGESRSNKRVLSSVAGQQGNVFIVGSFGQIEGETYINNFFLEKYAADGTVAWQKVFNPSNGNDVNGILLQVDANGNPVIYLIPLGFGDPVRLKKYDAEGTLLWEYQKTVFAPALQTFFLDATGNTYLSGASKINDADATPVFTTIKVTPDGTEDWVATTPSANSADTIYEIASGTTDAQGNVIIGGAVGSGNFFEQAVNAILIRYNADGVMQSVTTTPVPGNNSAIAGVLVQDDGSIIANGAISDQNTGEEKMILRKYSSAGAQQWESVVEQEGRNVRSYKTVLLNNGELATAAYSVLYGVNNKIIVTRFDQLGNQLQLSETALGHYYRDFASDGENVYLLSQIYGTTIPYRLFNSGGAFYSGIISKIGNGAIEDELLPGPQLSPFDPANIVMNGNHLLIPGTLESEASVFQGIYFFESDFELLGSGNPEGPSSQADWLGQNYPNPARGTVIIPVDLTNADTVDLRLYDATGRLIAKLHNGQLPSGRSEVAVSVNGLSSGIYIYQARLSNGVSASRKLVIE